MAFFRSSAAVRQESTAHHQLPADPSPVANDRFYEELIAQRPALVDEKVKLHAQIIDEFNVAALDRLPREELAKEVLGYVAEYLRTEKISLNQKELLAFVEEIVDEMIGYGPIEPLLKDPTITDILINTHKRCFIERFGKLEQTTVHFKDEAHLMRIVQKIVAGVGRRVDESSPTCDARLPDGSRVNVAVPPISVDGALVSIRKFSKKPFSLDRLVEIGTLRPQIVDVLTAAVRGRVSLIISGGTGSGKTTVLNALSAHVPPAERLITIEDAAELQLQQPHVVRLETRPPNIEGKGEVTQRALVKNALRMRPDRIILGEVRGAEAVDMLQAMNTGHDGSLATIHANTPRDALARLENMIGMAGLNLPPKAARQQISSAITAVVQIARLSDGKRKVMSLQEITGMEGDIITMQEIFSFRQTGIGADGAVQGHFAASGVRPKFVDRLRAFGVTVPDTLFDPSRQYA